MKRCLVIIVCLLSIELYSQMSTPVMPTPNLKFESVTQSSSHRQKIDRTNNIGMVLGGSIFITAGWLGERNYSKDNGFKGIAKVVSPGKLAMIMGSGCVVIGLTIRL